MDKIADKMFELIEAAKQAYGRDYSDVSWKMNGRLTSTAGRAYLTERRMEFSTKLYAENKEAFVEDTVGHEFAHIIAYDIFQDRGHGTGWKSVMNTLGINSQRCHSYKVESRTKKTYKYVCDCQTHEVTPQRKSWIDRGKIYRCVHCNTIIRPM